MKKLSKDRHKLYANSHHSIMKRKNLFHAVSKVTIFLLIYSLGNLFLKTSTPAATPTSKYHLIKKIVLGGEGRWDYLALDSATRRLYITRETRVTVMDVDTSQVVGEIEGGAGVHGVAIAPELNHGFFSNGRSATATIFDLKTLQVLGEVKTGLNPDTIVYDSFSQRVFTFNGNSANATVFDAKTFVVIGTIPLGGSPEFAIADGAGHIYVNLESKNEVSVLDTSKLKIKANWSLAACSEPTGIAMDKQNRRLFITCRNQLMVVVNARSGRIKATLPIGKGSDASVFDPETKLAFSSNGEGTLTVVREASKDKFSVVDNVITQRGARTMALDLKTHNVFLATAQFVESTPTPSPSMTPARPSIVPKTFTILVVGQ